jgi:hypothetical protein
MNTFWYFFTTKAKQCEQDIIRLRRVLETLAKTREGSRAMKNYIKELRVRCKQAEAESEESLKKLIEKTTIVEKLKAKLGMGGSLATLMQMQDESVIVTHNFDGDSKLLEDGKLRQSSFFVSSLRNLFLFLKKRKTTNTTKSSIE